MNDPLANLTSQAIDDFAGILERSLNWGASRAAKTRRDLVQRFLMIAAGQARGHKRPDLLFQQPTLCLAVAPHVIIYNPDNFIVLRVVDGRRDFRALAEDEPPSR